jgi:hypothetical protein
MDERGSWYLFSALEINAQYSARPGRDYCCVGPKRTGGRGGGVKEGKCGCTL